MKKNTRYSLTDSSTTSPWAAGLSVIVLLIGRAGAIALAATLTTSASFALSESANTKFVPFTEFIANTHAANFNDFHTRSDSKVKDEASFEEMRQSIVDRYQGVQVTHSFLVGGLHYDCVPILQQPAVRNFHLSSIALLRYRAGACR